MKSVNLNDQEEAREQLLRALETQHAETVARAIVANLWPLYTGHFALLKEAVLALPNAVLDRYPLLRGLHPAAPFLCRSSGRSRVVVAADAARPPSPEELDFVTLAQMVACRYRGDAPAALDCARRLGERMLQPNLEIRDHIDGPLWFFHYQIGSTLLAAGDSSGALVEFATALRVGRFASQPDVEHVIVSRAALAHALRGTRGEAERALDRAETLPPATEAHISGSRAAKRAARALIAVDRLSDDVDERLSALQPFDSVDLSWPLELLARCRAYLARQHPEDALEAIHLATDAHVVLPGSLAADVVASTTIDALVAAGDLAGASRAAEANRRAGVLTGLAVARLALHDGRFEAASRSLRLLATDQSLGPAQRSESVLLSGWLEFGRAGKVSPETAIQILRVAQRPDSRRVLTFLPRQLIDHVREALPADDARAFETSAAGLSHVEMRSRPSLTAGETRILNALPSYHSTALLASSFHVSPNTIKSQLRSIYRKLGCSTRDEAIRTATRLRLLDYAMSGDVTPSPSPGSRTAADSSSLLASSSHG